MKFILILALIFAIAVNAQNGIIYEKPEIRKNNNVEYFYNN
jgi:hypothetical protein